MLRDLLPETGLADDEWSEQRNADGTSTFLIKSKLWWEFFWTEYRHKYDGEQRAAVEQVKSAKWFPAWWRQCVAEQLRRIVEGLRLADGVEGLRLAYGVAA